MVYRQRNVLERKSATEGKHGMITWVLKMKNVGKESVSEYANKRKLFVS